MAALSAMMLIQLLSACVLKAPRGKRPPLADHPNNRLVVCNEFGKAKCLVSGTNVGREFGENTNGYGHTVEARNVIQTNEQEGIDFRTQILATFTVFI